MSDLLHTWLQNLSPKICTAKAAKFGHWEPFCTKCSKEDHSLMDEKWWRPSWKLKEKDLTPQTELHSFLKRLFGNVWPCTQTIVWNYMISRRFFRQDICRVQIEDQSLSTKNKSTWDLLHTLWQNKGIIHRFKIFKQCSRCSIKSFPTTIEDMCKLLMSEELIYNQI